MHFRIRKNVIQLIRTTYDDSKKKGVNTIIGTVRLSKPVLTDELNEKLTQQEQNAFEIWLNSQHKTDRLREELTALTLADSMSLAEKWFEREGQTSAAQIAARDIVFHWQSLRKALFNQGLLD